MRFFSMISLVLCLSYSLSFSQERTLGNIEGSYIFKSGYTGAISPQKNKATSASVDILDGSIVTVLSYNKEAKTVDYKYWQFTGNSQNITKYNSGLIFTMNAEQFDQLTDPLYARFKGTNVGLYTVPFRLRDVGGSNFDFESSLSLQANMVFGLGSRKSSESWFDASVGIGLTSVNLTPINSNVTENRTASAFTLSLGAVFKPTKVANIGVFVGWDNLGANDREVNWVYNRKPWIGVGLNISFNAIKTEKTAVE